MADLSITAANVIAGADSVQRIKLASEAITAGKVLAINTTTQTVGLADNNSATATVREVYGVALNGASTGQPVVVHTKGLITIGATMTAGVAYYLSDTPGGVCPVADLASGEYPTVLGIATSTTVFNFQPQAAGVAL